MSHFSVVVCIDDPQRLGDVLARWDENREVEPYRDYEEGEPSEHWLYRSLKKTAEDEQRRKQKADAELFRSLPDPLTWADFAKLWNARYADAPPLLVAEDGRAYQMSTSNPEAKWDWWRVGGRFSGYFPYRQEFARQVIRAHGGEWDSPGIAPLHCNGGQKCALDLAALREEKAASARKTYEEWQGVTAGTPEAMPWAQFRKMLDTVPGYTIERAREEYHSQPRVQAIAQTDFRWRDDPVAEFAPGVALYAERARAGAVPGYATVTMDGRWLAPGRMGWFGASDDELSDRMGYWEVANAYIDALPDSAYLVALDCHI